MRLARDLGVSPRRLWGWEPETQIVADGDEWRLVREPEFGKEDYEMLAALVEHEATVDSSGFPLEETMSPLADPDRPDGTHYYQAKPIRDWALQAQHEAESDPKWQGDNYTPARKWRVEKVMR